MTDPISDVCLDQMCTSYGMIGQMPLNGIHSVAHAELGIGRSLSYNGWCFSNSIVRWCHINTTNNNAANTNANMNTVNTIVLAMVYNRLRWVCNNNWFGTGGRGRGHGLPTLYLCAHFPLRVVPAPIACGGGVAPCAPTAAGVSGALPVLAATCFGFEG